MSRGRYMVETIGAIGGCRCDERATIGDLVPVVVWPSDVEAKKKELDPQMRALELAADSCGTLSAETAIAVNDFLDSWKTFRATAPSLLSAVIWAVPGVLLEAHKQWAELERFETRMRDWYTELEQRGCKGVAPRPPDPPPSEDVTGTIKTVAIAAAVVAGAVVVAPVIWEWIAAKKTGRRLKKRAA